MNVPLLQPGKSVAQQRRAVIILCHNIQSWSCVTTSGHDSHQSSDGSANQWPRQQCLQGQLADGTLQQATVACWHIAHRHMTISLELRASKVQFRS